MYDATFQPFAISNQEFILHLNVLKTLTSLETGVNANVYCFNDSWHAGCL